MGTSARQQIKIDYEEQVYNWQHKNERLEEKIKTNLGKYKRISQTNEVWTVLLCLVLSKSASLFCLTSLHDLSFLCLSGREEI